MLVCLPYVLVRSGFLIPVLLMSVLGAGCRQLATSVASRGHRCCTPIPPSSKQKFKHFPLGFSSSWYKWSVYASFTCAPVDVPRLLMFYWDSSSDQYPVFVWSLEIQILCLHFLCSDGFLSGEQNGVETSSSVNLWLFCNWLNWLILHVRVNLSNF